MGGPSIELLKITSLIKHHVHEIGETYILISHPNLEV